MSSPSRLTLRGITWNHTRGFVPLVATAQLFMESHPQVEIVWEKRSLQEFADAPIAQLGDRYDLLVIDHPWAGFSAAHGVLLPLNEHLSAEFIVAQRYHQVGASHDSYLFNGQQTALAIDAATPVASWRPDLIASLPQTWEDVIALGRAGRVLVAAIPVDALMSYYMMCHALGESPFQSERRVVSPATGRAALALLRELTAVCPPRCFDMNPIAVYRELSSGSTYHYCPFAYGYSNYSRAGYAPHRLQFGDLVKVRGSPLRSTLGGTGLGISTQTRHRELALQYAQMVASPEIQRTVYTASGGQPGHRTAWVDPDNNQLTSDYFSRTLPALDRAYVRPRYDGYMHFQDHAGGPVRQFLIDGGDPDATLAIMDRLYVESLAGPSP